jgi:hypothetical protein
MTALIVVLAVGVVAAQPGAISVVTGRVVEAGTGAPIADARVMLFPDRPQGATAPRQATADRDGRYVFENVAAGRYRVTAGAPGYAPSGPGNPLQMVVVIVDSTGQPPPPLEHVLSRGGVIAGQVVDPSGRPLLEARVLAVRRSSGTAGPLVPGGSSGMTNDLR